jgi:hypothetical protein
MIKTTPPAHHERRLRVKRVSAAIFYRQYKKALPPKERKDAPNYAQYKVFVEHLYKRIMHEMIVNTYVFRPPLKFGEFFVRAYKFADYNRMESRITGLIRRFFYDIRWHKVLCRVENHTFYTFKLNLGGVKDGLFWGEEGLTEHISRISKDPTKTNYTPVIYER